MIYSRKINYCYSYVEWLSQSTMLDMVLRLKNIKNIDTHFHKIHLTKL